MKECCRCKVPKEISEFQKNKSTKDGLQKVCTECRKKISKNWYVNHTEKHKKSVQKIKTAKENRIREFLFHYLEQHSCVDCKENDPIVLEFDHVRGKKFLSISKMVSVGYNLQRIANEIDKCDIRCCNCHRRKTAKQFNHFKHIFARNLRLRR